MRALSLLVAAALALVPVAGMAKTDAPVSVARPDQSDPAWPTMQASLRAAAEKAITDQLTDPESARFKWKDGQWLIVKDFEPGPWQRLNPFKAAPVSLSPPIPGQVVLGCGMVNSKNRSGGYNGYEFFDVAYQDGKVVSQHIDQPTDDLSAAKQLCFHYGIDPR